MVLLLSARQQKPKRPTIAQPYAPYSPAPPPPTNVIRDELQTYFFFETFLYVGANSRVWALSANFTQYLICLIPVIEIQLYIYLIFETSQPNTNKTYKTLESKIRT